MEVDLLTIAEVAALAKVSRRTVERWISSGELPVVLLAGRRTAGSVRLEKQIVESFLAWRAGEADRPTLPWFPIAAGVLLLLLLLLIFVGEALDAFLPPGLGPPLDRLAELIALTSGALW